MTHIICIPYSWRAEILEKVFLMMVRFFVCVMTQDVARWHSSSKKTKMLIFVRISVMIRQHLAFGHVGPSCWHFLPTYVLPVLQSPSSVPPSSWAYPHPRPKGDSHFSIKSPEHCKRAFFNVDNYCSLWFLTQMEEQASREDTVFPKIAWKEPTDWDRTASI